VISNGKNKKGGGDDEVEEIKQDARQENSVSGAQHTNTPTNAHKRTVGWDLQANKEKERNVRGQCLEKKT
jgi:hypothetical protein